MRKCKVAKNFYNTVDKVSKAIPPVTETVKKVPDIYKRGK